MFARTSHFQGERTTGLPGYDTRLNYRGSSVGDQVSGIKCRGSSVGDQVSGAQVFLAQNWLKRITRQLLDFLNF